MDTQHKNKGALRKLKLRNRSHLILSMRPRDYVTMCLMETMVTLSSTKLQNDSDLSTTCSIRDKDL